MTLDRIVVAGGSIAAVTAVETLRMENFPGQIIMLSDEDLPPYTRVPLSKVTLSGGEPAGEIPVAHEVDLGGDAVGRLGGTSSPWSSAMSEAGTTPAPLSPASTKSWNNPS